MGTAAARRKEFPLFKEYQKELSNPIAMVYRASEGVGVGVFDALQELTILGKAQLAAFLDATPKTIDNYRIRKRKLGRPESEQLLQIMGLYKKGVELFGTVELFNEWLRKPAYGLGNQQPFDLLYTAGGIQLVLEELLRIEYGALA
ncbi:MAG TPA: antitoxin Xre/MbcA/ParS toxin-binding domain-containing protein [Flavisolibacter sp.]|jgi:putative toxin-antitoxin system antitoxin component (TIGR02293 family)|nr:antitoxin Xre/MbcA/ParS toxin-binding domain-containing protein [Flavisolibacter sp.]